MTAVPIKDVPVFSDLTNAEIRRVRQLMTPATIRTGKTFIKEGCPGLKAYFVVGGTAAVSQDDQVIATVGPGDVLGEISVLTGSDRTASVTALEDLQVEVMTRRDLLTVVDEVPGLARKIAATAVRRIHRRRPGVTG